MDSKTARASMVKAPKDAAPKRSNAEMISEIRKLRAGKLFLSSMEYIDALLQEHDNTQESNKLLRASLQADDSKITELNRQVANWQGIANERAAKIAQDFETIANLEKQLAQATAPKPGTTIHEWRPSSDKEARVQQIMDEHNCSRGNALKVYKKEQESADNSSTEDRAGSPEA